MRVVIVITTTDPEYELWDLSSIWNIDSNYAETVVRKQLVGIDWVLVLCQAESNEKAAQAVEREIRSLTTRRVTELVNLSPYVNAEKLYVAAHTDSVDWRNLKTGIDGTRKVSGAFFSHQSGSAKERTIFDELQTLFKTPDSDGVDNAIECLVRAEVSTRSRRLAAIRHQLAHVFLPVKIDLHACREFKFDDDYIREVVKSYATDNDRMDRARALVYDQPGITGVDTVEKLVNDAGMGGDSSWHEVESLLPRREPRDSVEQLNNELYSEVFIEGEFWTLLKDKNRLRRMRTWPIAFDDWTESLDAALVGLSAKIED